MIITSNLALEKWNEIFQDQLLTGAIIDRLTNMSYLVNMTGSSYRIQQTKEWMNDRQNKNSSRRLAAAEGAINHG